MGIIRITKQKNFSIISNTALYDSKLTFKAKGLWAYLLSKPDDWNVHVNQLVKAGPDGKTAIYSALKELKEYGYMEHRPIRKGGKISGYEYIINEEPPGHNGTENLHSENLNVEKLDAENRDALLKTDSLLKTDFNKNDVPPDPQQTPPNPPPAVPPPPSPSMKLKKTAQLPTPATETATMETAIAALCAMIPEPMLKPSVIALITRSLKNGHTQASLESAIAYTRDNSNGGTWKKFKAYLGKTIEGGWSDGYSGKDAVEDTEAKDKAAIKGRLGLPVDLLMEQAKAGDRYAKEALKIMGYQAVS